MNLEDRIARLEALHPDLAEPEVEWVELGTPTSDPEPHRMNPQTGEMQYESPPASGHWHTWVIGLLPNRYEPLFAAAYRAGLAQGRKEAEGLAEAVLTREKTLGGLIPRGCEWPDIVEMARAILGAAE